MDFIMHRDCRYFQGDMPCRYWRSCHNCDLYNPVTKRILIVMLIKLGDILIASPLPKAIKKLNPGAHITWLVDISCANLVRNNSYVDDVVIHGWDSLLFLERCNYDLVLGFERERSAASLVDKINAREKRGLAFGGDNNSLYPLCSASERFFKLNIWNEYRTKINKSTWTEFYFELAGLKYNGETYELEINQLTREIASNLTGSQKYT